MMFVLIAGVWFVAGGLFGAWIVWQALSPRVSHDPPGPRPTPKPRPPRDDSDLNEIIEDIIEQAKKAPPPEVREVVGGEYRIGERECRATRVFYVSGVEVDTLPLTGLATLGLPQPGDMHPADCTLIADSRPQRLSDNRVQINYRSAVKRGGVNEKPIGARPTPPPAPPFPRSIQTFR